MTYYLIYNQVNDTLSVGIDSRYSNSNLMTLFKSYKEEGYYNNRPSVTIKNSGFTFTIETNFGYSQKSYLRFKAEYNGSVLYCFQNKSDEYSHATISKYFNVEPDPENWDKLFDLLCQVYKNKESWNINECLKWIEVRNKKDVIESPIELAETLKDYLDTIKECHIETCTPVMEGTNTILERELPILTKNILTKGDTPQIRLDTKDAIESACDYLVSNDHILNPL